MISLQVKQDISLKKSITLPGSKSISNRYLILRTLSNNKIEIENLSNADDTKTLESALLLDQNNINIGHAGTAMRFLLAYLSIKQGKYVLTGSLRMLERPIGPLVEAINEMGGNVDYISKIGYPPVLIKGQKIKGGEISLNSSVSSQFVSAILLIAPFLKEGIKIHLSRKTVSFSYINMTLKILNGLGIKTDVNNDHISVIPHKIMKQKVKVEGDWSSASYWFSFIALSPIGTEMSLLGLKRDSIQGDKRIIDIMKHFGVKSDFNNAQLNLKKCSIHKDELEFDFINCPDIAQTVMVAGAALNMRIKFRGLQTLKIKESDRVEAMNTELIKVGYSLLKTEDIWVLEGEFISEDITIETYKDHRIAMSFAPLILKIPKIKICDPEVVNKSYPDYWRDLKNFGISIDKIT